MKKRKGRDEGESVLGQRVPVIEDPESGGSPNSTGICRYGIQRETLSLVVSPVVPDVLIHMDAGYMEKTWDRRERERERDEVRQGENGGRRREKRGNK